MIIRVNTKTEQTSFASAREAKYARQAVTGWSGNTHGDMWVRS